MSISNTRSRRGFSTTGVFAALMLVAMACGNTASAAEIDPKWQPSKVVTGVATGTTSTGYVSGNAMFGAITQQTGVDFRLVPFERSPEQALGLKQQTGDFGIWYAAIVLQALTGSNTYETLNLPPQSVRTLWNGGDLTQGLVTRGDSDIKTMSDLKGAKVVSYEGDPALNSYYMDAVLAYAGLTWDDVKPIPVGGYGEALRAILDGSADVAFSSTPGGQMYELEASTHGIHWVPMPAEETEAWARFHKVNPSFYPQPATVGAGLSKENPVPLWAYNYQLVAYDWQDPQLTYWLTKQVVEQYDNYKDTHAYLQRWTVDHGLQVSSWFIPWHEGSVQYLKDAGLWTQEMNEKQQELLKRFPQTMTK